MKYALSERVKQLPDSDFERILKLATENKKIISLGPGEPDFDTPNHLIKQSKKYFDAHYTHYSPAAGRTDLKKQIVKTFKKENKLDYNENQIMVTNGSTEGIMLSLMTLIDPSEQVLVQDPSFLAYLPAVELMNGYPVSVPVYEKNKFQLTAEDIEKRIQDPKKVRAMILCSPNNPTGTVFTKKTLEEIADVAVEHDFILISDEAYEKFVYGEKYVSIAELNGMQERSLVLRSFSKTYAMPGYRLGYLAGPEKIVKPMGKLHLYTTLTAGTNSQLTGLEALRGPQACVKEMAKEYNKRRKLVVQRLNEIPGFNLVEPKGAFYAFPSIHFKNKSRKMSSTQFVKYLIKEANVLTVPGNEFGRYGEGFIRISYATAYDKIEKAFNKIEKATKKLKIL